MDEEREGDKGIKREEEAMVHYEFQLLGFHLLFISREKEIMVFYLAFILMESFMCINCINITTS